MEQIRSFIAIELPDKIKQELTQLEGQLKSDKQTFVKWADPYSIHLTLKFLGNIDISRTGTITTAIEDATKGISPFHLEVRDLGVFPNLRRAQVAWVGLSGDIAKLGQLQQHIESNLAQLGFSPESRPFKPHLTLARLRNQATLDERQRFGQLIAGHTSKTEYTFKVDAVSLMRSQLTREGAIYSRISSVGLKKPLLTDST